MQQEAIAGIEAFAPAEVTPDAGSFAEDRAVQFQGLAAALAAAVDGSRKRDGIRIDALSAAVARQEQDLGTAVDGLMVLREVVQRLTDTVATVQEANVRHESVVTGLYNETQELAVTLGPRLDTFSAQIEACQKDVGTIKNTLAEVCSRVSSISDRVDRHAETIRSVCEAETMAEIALDQFVEIWTRLKASVTTKGITRVSAMMESEQKSNAGAAVQS